ncbi:tetratricopeptide repeat protein [Sphingomonas sp. RG327]|uniref:Tetratricopeptide repeat protein n=1 Tax=Sphingomonas anseongensis TaxID=2908207 RepID=A0ABT0RD46_9SPHN|nr:tetratricopeptide repeat protein [Sphingomonas anseongensis]
MNGWIILALLFAVAVAGLWLLRVRGALLQLSAAALLFGCAGYALQGHPFVAGSPREAASVEPALPLRDIRHAFFGHFTGEESWLSMSEALASAGDTEDAVGVLQNAVGKYPGNPQLWIGLGNALVDHARTMTPASEYAYRRAAELAPGHPAPPFFAGLALARSGNRDTALAMWKEILASAPADADWRPLVEDAIAALNAPPPRQPTGS